MLLCGKEKNYGEVCVVSPGFDSKWVPFAYIERVVMVQTSIDGRRRDPADRDTWRGWIHCETKSISIPVKRCVCALGGVDR